MKKTVVNDIEVPNVRLIPFNQDRQYRLEQRIRNKISDPRSKEGEAWKQLAFVQQLLIGTKDKMFEIVTQRRST